MSIYKYIRKKYTARNINALTDETLGSYHCHEVSDTILLFLEKYFTTRSRSMDERR